MSDKLKLPLHAIDEKDSELWEELSSINSNKEN